MPDEVINVLFDVREAKGVPTLKRYVERSEDRSPIVGAFYTTMKIWERLGRPESINVQLRRVL